MPVKLSDAVVVITGASSGIGKAAALEFAERGATVVVAARRGGALEETADECRSRGALALAVPTDVTDEHAVHELARRTLEHFGHIDVWVNNAGVGAAGRFAEVPAEPFRRIFETNFFGCVHGARAALPVFRRQGRGTLINIASMVSELAEPYFSSYVASKHAVHGLGKSLRQELHLEGLKKVHVCTIMPAAIDTPFFQHAANYTGRALKAIPPVYAVSKAAKAIVACAESPRRHFFVGNSARMFNLQYRLSSFLAERALARMVERHHFYPDRGVPVTDGNVFAPMAEGSSVEGGWKTPGGFHVKDEESRKRPFRAGRGTFAAGVLALVMGTAAYLLRKRSGLAWP